MARATSIAVESRFEEHRKADEMFTSLQRESMHMEDFQNFYLTDHPSMDNKKRASHR